MASADGTAADLLADCPPIASLCLDRGRRAVAAGKAGRAQRWLAEAVDIGLAIGSPQVVSDAFKSWPNFPHDPAETPNGR